MSTEMNREHPGLGVGRCAFRTDGTDSCGYQPRWGGEPSGLEWVAEEFGNAAASPPGRTGRRETLTAEDIRTWLADAKGLDTTNSTVQREDTHA